MNIKENKEDAHEVCQQFFESGDADALLARYMNIHEPTHVISGCTGLGRFQNLQRPVTYTHDGWSYTRGLLIYTSVWII